MFVWSHRTCSIALERILSTPLPLYVYTCCILISTFLNTMFNQCLFRSHQVVSAFTIIPWSYNLMYCFALLLLRQWVIILTSAVYVMRTLSFLVPSGYTFSSCLSSSSTSLDFPPYPESQSPPSFILVGSYITCPCMTILMLQIRIPCRLVYHYPLQPHAPFDLTDHSRRRDRTTFR